MMCCLSSSPVSATYFNVNYHLSNRVEHERLLFRDPSPQVSVGMVRGQYHVPNCANCSGVLFPEFMAPVWCSMEITYSSTAVNVFCDLYSGFYYLVPMLPFFVTHNNRYVTDVEVELMIVVRHHTFGPEQSFHFLCV